MNHGWYNWNSASTVIRGNSSLVGAHRRIRDKSSLNEKYRCSLTQIAINVDPTYFDTCGSASACLPLTVIGSPLFGAYVISVIRSLPLIATRNRCWRYSLRWNPGRSGTKVRCVVRNSWNHNKPRRSFINTGNILLLKYYVFYLSIRISNPKSASIKNRWFSILYYR